jgi:hypothetical protein
MSKQEETIPVGFKVTKSQREELQRWASYFAGQKSIDPQTGKKVPIIERPQIGLLIKEATYAFIYQYKFFLQMKDNPKLMQVMESLGQQIQTK